MSIDRRIHLKIKIKSLAEESKLIRKEERKAKDELRDDLVHHRRHVVRQEARCSLLAYGFIRGKAYKDMEKHCRIMPNWNRVKKLVESFQPFYNKEKQREQVDEWHSSSMVERRSV